MVLLFPLTFLATWWACHRRAELLGFAAPTRRASFVVAFVVLQVEVLAIANVMSIGDHFRASFVVLGWLVCLVGALVAAGGVGALRTWRPEAGWRRLLERAGVDTIVAVLVLAAMFVVFVLTAVLYLPNNADSLAYHLTKVAMWIQNGSIAPYAAHFTPEIELGPLMEYDLAMLHLLGGTDYWDGFVQLSAVLVCVVAVSELARRLGLGRLGQAFAAVFCATIPSLVLEATSTTNNVFAAATSIALVVVAVEPVARQRWARRALVLGCAAGQAYLAKGTAAPMFGVLVALFVGLAAWGIWRSAPNRRGLWVITRAGVVGALAVVVTVGPFVAQNISVFGTVSGPVSQGLLVEGRDPAPMAGNVLRQLASEYHIGNGRNWEYDVSSFMSRGFGTIARSIGQYDGKAGYTLDPVGDANPFVPRSYEALQRSEDVSADPWHTALIGLAFVVLAVLAWRRRKALPLLAYLGLCVGFLAFAMLTKWTMFGTRYYIPLLVAWAPLVAYALEGVSRWVTRVVALLLVAAAIPSLFMNGARPLWHRTDDRANAIHAYLLGAGWAGDWRTYQEVVDRIATSGCDRVGLLNWMAFPYVIQAGLDRAGWHGRIENVGVSNASKELEDPSFRPCAEILDTMHAGDDGPRNGVAPIPYGMLRLYLFAT